MPYDYIEHLLENDSNRELPIIKESSETETAYGEILSTASKTELSKGIVPQKEGNVNTQFSLSSMASTFFGDENMSALAFKEADYKQTQGYFYIYLYRNIV